MYKFIEDIRESRRMEINDYKNKGIKFIKENHYKLIERINIARGKEQFSFEVRVDFKEVRFYIVKFESCIYLSVYEIYSLLNEIYINSDIDIVKELKKIYDCEKDKFECNNNEYEFPRCSFIESHYKIKIPNSSLEITYNELLLLIFLIQEKSNYLCSLSQEMKPYKNGLINLLIVLLNVSRDNEELKKIGWNYSSVDNKYLQNVLGYLAEDDENYDIRKKIVDRKYYLTKEEMNGIVGL